MNIRVWLYVRPTCLYIGLMLTCWVSFTATKLVTKLVVRPALLTVNINIMN